MNIQSAPVVWRNSYGKVRWQPALTDGSRRMIGRYGRKVWMDLGNYPYYNKPDPALCLSYRIAFLWGAIEAIRIERKKRKGGFQEYRNKYNDNENTEES